MVRVALFNFHYIMTAYAAVSMPQENKTLLLLVCSTPVACE